MGKAGYIFFVLSFVLAGLILSSCHSDKKSLLAQIESEEKVIDSGGSVTDEDLWHLSDLYRLFLDKWPGDKERYCRFTYRKAGVMARLDMLDSAKLLLQESIFSCADIRDVHPFALDLLIAVLSKDERNSYLASAIRRGISDRYPAFYNGSITRSPGGGDVSLYQMWYQAEMHFDTVSTIPPRSAMQRHIETAQALSLVYPRDEETVPEAMYKAARYAYAMGEYKVGVELLEWIKEHHPKVEIAPSAIVLLGFLYENELNDLTKAQRSYEFFLNKYPKHPMKDQVEASIQHLGKSPDELIEIFRAREQEE